MYAVCAGCSSWSGLQPAKDTSPLFIPLHWLPAAAHIKFKSLMLAYRAAASTATTYLNSLIQIYEPPRSLQMNQSLCHSLAQNLSPNSSSVWSLAGVTKRYSVTRIQDLPLLRVLSHLIYSLCLSIILFLSVLSKKKKTLAMHLYAPASLVAFVWWK